MSKTCCSDCKGKIREHVASILPFKILEAALGAPLRISGVAMAAGMSRNFNVYTPEELQSFAPLLVGAPVYIEHVAVDFAAGKVTKCTYDPTSRCLLYEAEIYDPVIADKIRNGLIQHVSVGADYDALDVVDAKIPHGLSKPELSLVAVPGIPETNIQVLEHLKESLAHNDHGKIKLKAKEALGEAEVFCVFCSNPADYFVSICQSCVDKFSVSVTNFVGVEKMDEKVIVEISEKIAAKIDEKNISELKKLQVELNEVSAKLKAELAEAKAKLAENEDKVKVAETARDEANGKLAASNKSVEKLRKIVPAGLELLVDPPVLMPVVEHIAILEKRLPSVMAERSSLGLQRHAQEMRAEIMQAKEKLKAK
jgi:hypothetical protein